MRVLSLFDGISCGRLALHNLGIKPERYFAFEIDKAAIKISQKNWSDIIQCGDVNFHTWHDLHNIDLLIGGSPCQGFSNAGSYTGFGHAGSELFFKFVECLNFYKPKYFMLENVRMKKEWCDKISSYVGYDFIQLNSKDFGAQSRIRNYWTNFPVVQRKKKSKKIIFDILDDQKNWGKIQGTYTLYEGRGRYFTKEYLQRQKIYFDNSDSLNNVGKSNLDYNLFNERIFVHSIMHKSCTIMKTNGIKIALDNKFYRFMTDTELERLQGLPGNYTQGISTNQRNACIGNSWHVPTIEYILKQII